MTGRLPRVLGLLAGVAAAAAVSFWVVRNPEHSALTAEVRAATGYNYASLGRGVTRFELAGPVSGEPVVLVHGFSVPLYIWDSTFAALASAGFRVLRYDLLGRGYSDRPRAEYGAELFDQQLVELLDHVDMRTPVHVVGLSMGGWVAATFGSRHPERVRSVTLVDPAAGPRAAPGLLAWPLVGPFLWQTTRVPGMAAGQSGDFVDPSRFPDWAERYRVQMQYRGFGRALRSTALHLAAIDFDSVYADFGLRGHRTMLIWGTEDQVVPFELSAGVRAAIPGAEFHAIPGTGHLPHLERADTVSPLLIRFLRAGRQPAEDSAAVLLAAREILAESRYATLVTQGLDGHPQARVVDPFAPEADFTIWVATNARTRKAAEIARDRRVSLLYFDRAGGSYVTVVGRAELVRDSTARAEHWKEEWAAFYQDRHLGDDYLLIRVRPTRLEISSERHGLRNDPASWRPVIVTFP